MSFWNPKLGIDLGTANTLVFIPGKGIVLNEPSVVAVSQNDRKVLAIGNEAKEMIGRTPDAIVAYRPMQGGVIADYRVAEAMLRYFYRKALGPWTLFKPEVMVSVPAGITSTERRAIVEAAIKAGASDAYVVKEPILSAIGAGIPIYDAVGHMIVDIGGGTTDVAVISLGGIVSSTSVKVAGDTFDRTIIDYVKKHHNLAIGEKTAERIKITIGSALPVEKDENLEVVVKGRDYVTGLPRAVHLSTNQIAGALQADLRHMVQALKDVLNQTPPELASDIIDNGIIMTGGTSQLKNLTQLVYQRTGVKAVLADDPLYCVAKGTECTDHLAMYKRAILQKL